MVIDTLFSYSISWSLFHEQHHYCLHAIPFTRKLYPASKSLWYNRPYTPPKITPHPSATLPRIRIHNLEIIHQPRLLKLSNIRCRGTKAHSTKRRPTRFIQIQLQRLCQAPGWEIRRRITQSVVGGAKAIGYGCGNGGVILRDEITPDGLESFVEIWSLVGCGRTKVGGYVCAMLGADRGILVFVGDAAIVGKGFSEPVGGADECCFRVNIL